jgi:hypothetical protein
LVAASPVAADTFTDSGKKELKSELQEAQKKEQAAATFDWGWDLAFKIVLLVIAVLTTAGTGYAGTFAANAAPRWLRISNFVLAGLTTALGTFISQLDLTGKQTLHLRKVSAYQYLADEVAYTSPDKQTFLAQLQRVRETNDSAALLIVRETPKAAKPNGEQ